MNASRSTFAAPGRARSHAAGTRAFQVALLSLFLLLCWLAIGAATVHADGPNVRYVAADGN